MVKERKKYESGAATRFISRNRALRKLQISLADFRRLCILKGIYPHEPKNKKKAAKGNRAVQTFFFVKDIQFISHEPIINTFRQLKIFMRKITKAKHKGNWEQVKRLKLNRPKLNIDHIVKERYPSFIDAIRDLDDCLTMCFVFATFPKSRGFLDTIKLCHRLTVEFLYYVIASRSLRKVFVSIKGIYYQAEIMGQQVTWIVPHKRGFQSGSDVDFKIMQTFVQFYTTFLGFVNYQLYCNLNLHYPPKLYKEEDLFNEDGGAQPDTDWELQEELISALSMTLKGENTVVDDENVDEYPITAGEDDEAIAQAKMELEEEKRQRLMFENLKFFINRECPKEDLTFMLRCFGGQVSWDKTSGIGSSFDECDETITHQIVDRPSVPNQYLSRYYVQPQWIFDSINARRLLPESDYFMGAILPPHFSPFVSTKPGDYDPLQKVAPADDQQQDQPVRREKLQAQTPVTQQSNVETVSQTEKGQASKMKKPPPASQHHWSSGSESSNDEDRTADEVEEPKKMRKMRVAKGKIAKVNPLQKRDTENEQRKLAEMMIPKKKRRLYQKIMTSRKKKAKEVKSLVQKRAAYDKQKGKTV